MFYEALGDFVPNPGENSIPLAVGQVVQVHQLEVPEEPKPKLFTAIAHVMARNPNELSLQLAEEVEVSVWLFSVSCLCTYLCIFN